MRCALLKRFLVVLIIFTPLLYLHINSSYAQNSKDFLAQADVLYNVTSGKTVHVTQKIKLSNLKEFVYTPTYTITLRLKNISDVAAQNSKGHIPFTLEEGPNDSKMIRVEFPEKIVGAGKINDFTLSFSTSDYIHMAGNVYTVSIPATSNISDFETYTVQVATPENFGNPTVVKPKTEFDSTNHTHTFTKKSLDNSGISLIFGEKQYYFFKLSYNLENKNLFPIKTEIALPSNTSYQKVLIENLSPLPEGIHKDKDGNYMASYILPSKTAFSVKAHVLIESSFMPVSEELDSSLKKYYVRSLKYWESDDTIIKKTAQKLNGPQDIYNYVVKTLAYNTTKTADKNDRLGAAGVLSKPYYAVCLEFTDLFIALARSKGIPARSISGYAVTENDSSRPASLFEDVLHAWPEYYDESKRTWISVDPTWGNTTKGVDYFHSFDLDHVAFVRNGISSNYPIPAGGYKTQKNSKDIQVSFVDASVFQKRKKLTITSKFSPFLENNKIKGSITVLNKGNSEDAPQDAYVYVNEKKVMSVKFAKAPPYGRSSIDVRIPIPGYSIQNALTNVSHTVTIQDGRGKILNKATVSVFPLSWPFLIGGAVLIGSLIIFSIAFKTRSLPFQK